jgi:hypothetical protein
MVLAMLVDDRKDLIRLARMPSFLRLFKRLPARDLVKL